MKPTDMIYKEVKRQILALGLTEKLASDHADDAVDDYLKHKRGAGRSGWVNRLIDYNVQAAKKVGVKEK